MKEQVGIRFGILFLLLCTGATSATGTIDANGWSLAASPHFEVYSQAGAESAKRTVARLEEIRAFLNRTQILGFSLGKPDTARPTRVLEFRNAQEYSAVQIHPLAHAYYASFNDTSYIVTPVLSGNVFRVLAHEYTHHALHSAKVKAPSWLNEGLAEALSTVTITDRGCEFGGEIAAHRQTLRRNAWIAAPEFFRSERSDSHDPTRTSVFYAQSWAVADLLLNAPGFADKVAEFVIRVNSGSSSAQAFQKVYSRTQEEILAEARQWLRHGGSSKRGFPPLQSDTLSVKVSSVGEQQVRSTLADLFATNGDLDQSQQIYQDLLAQSPGNPDLLGSLGTLALRRGKRNQAVEYWRAAINAGLQDVALCYRYAQLADQMDLPTEELKRVLERVVMLRPGFDEVRYRLAQLESNRGESAAALVQLEAMKELAGGTFGYWALLASTLTELGRREEAANAAAKAQNMAADSEQFARAAQLAYFARTEMQVQYVRDAEGKLRLATIRAPWGSTVNPFAEAQDHMKSESGILRDVQCADDRLTAVLVETPADLLRLSVPDPARVLTKNGNSELTCGLQEQAVTVNVEYAATEQANVGVLRGMEVVQEATYKPVLQSPAAPGSAPVPPGKIPSSKGETSSSPGRIR